MSDIKLSIILHQTTSQEELTCCKEILQAGMMGLDTEICITEEASGKEEELIGNTKGEYILWIDSRIWPGEDILRTFCFFLDEHTEGGLIGAKLVDGHGVILPESNQKFPSAWKRLLHKSGIGAATGKPAGESGNKEVKCEIPSPWFYMFKKENWEKIRATETIYKDYPYEIQLADRMRTGGFTNYYIPERVLFRKEAQPVTYKNRRMLIIGYEKEIELIKKITSVKMPELEFVNVWDLDVNRVMDAICRSNKMKNFTDITFTWPGTRMEQILLFMEKMPEKHITYHIYYKKSILLVPADKL